MNRPFGSEFTRRLWTDVDHILLVYVGSAAEFALVEENHWLFYTGKLPAAPLNRLVSTFVWNRKVMEVAEEEAEALAKTIRGFHDLVEEEREGEEGGPRRISNRAFRAVGAMLIDYALLADEYLTGHPVAELDRESYYQDQRNFFEAMGITGWEESYADYAVAREKEVEHDLKRNDYTGELFLSYRRDLGWLRYRLLLLFMGHFLPEVIRKKLHLTRYRGFTPVFGLYPKMHGTVFARIVHVLLLPKRVRAAVT